jgi:serine/threonine protein kinase
MPTVIGQRYRVGNPCLAASVGTVCEGYDLCRYRPVIVWILPKSDTYRQKSLLRDVEAITGLKNENILELYEHWVEVQTGRLYLVFRQLDCRTLRSILAQSSPRPLSQGVARSIATGVLAAHQIGLVHRRINPFNILVGQNDVKLTGFGLAHLLQPSSLCADEILYLAPEQLDGEEGDERADLYSIGVVMFHALAGELPFYGVDVAQLRGCIASTRPTSPSLLNPQVPGPLESVVLRLLQEDPSLRYDTAAQVVDALNT